MHIPRFQFIVSRRSRDRRATRRPRRRCAIGPTVALIAAGFVLFRAPVMAQTNDMPLAELLAKPTNLATVASLATNAAQPEVQARLTEALRDPRAPVRAVAARVAFVTASRGLLPAARAALATEQDPAAANELIRLLVTFGAPEALDEAWAAVDRLDAFALPALAESLARLDRPELLTQLPRIVASGMTSRSLAARVLETTANDPARRQAAIDAFLGQPLSARELRHAMSARKEPLSPELAASFEKVLQDTSLKWPVAAAPDAPPARPVRMTPSFAPGLWRELAALYRCDPKRATALAAEVRYKPEGRPRQVSLVRDAVRGCTAMSGALMSLSVFGEARPAPADLVELQVLPWHKDVVACDEQPATWRRSGRTYAGAKNPESTLPTKLKEARPVFPRPLLGQNATIRLDAIASATGCPRELSVPQPGKEPLFDIAAILAVAQWRFGPAQVAGQPVDMWVVIETSFKTQ